MGEHLEDTNRDEYHLTDPIDNYIPSYIAQLRNHVLIAEQARKLAALGYGIKMKNPLISGNIYQNHHVVAEAYNNYIDPSTGVLYESNKWLIDHEQVGNDHLNLIVAGLLGLARIRDVDLTTWLKNNYNADNIMEAENLRSKEIRPLIKHLDSQGLIPEGKSLTIDGNPIIWRTELAQDLANYERVLGNIAKAILIIETEIERLASITEKDEHALGAAKAILLFRKSLLTGNLNNLIKALDEQTTHGSDNVQRSKDMAKASLRKVIHPACSGGPITRLKLALRSINILIR